MIGWTGVSVDRDVGEGGGVLVNSGMDEAGAGVAANRGIDEAAGGVAVGSPFDDSLSPPFESGVATSVGIESVGSTEPAGFAELSTIEDWRMVTGASGVAAALVPQATKNNAASRRAKQPSV